MAEKNVGDEIVAWVQLKKHLLLKSHYTSMNRMVEWEWKWNGNFQMLTKIQYTLQNFNFLVHRNKKSFTRIFFLLFQTPSKIQIHAQITSQTIHNSQIDNELMKIVSLQLFFFSWSNHYDGLDARREKISSDSSLIIFGKNLYAPMI